MRYGPPDVSIKPPCHAFVSLDTIAQISTACKSTKSIRHFQNQVGIFSYFLDCFAANRLDVVLGDRIYSQVTKGGRTMEEEEDQLDNGETRLSLQMGMFGNVILKIKLY